MLRSRGVVVIERGSPTAGSVEEANRTGVVGKAGSLMLRPLRCTAVDGTVVLLDGEHRIQGAEYAEESAAIASMVCCLGVFLRGKKAEAAEQTIVSAFVANGVSISMPQREESEQDE